jgi:hypothetical protein
MTTPTLTTPPLRSARDLADFIEQTCVLDGHHVVLHDVLNQVWVGYAADDGTAYLAHPPHRADAVGDVRSGLWLEELITDVADLPTWRFPMTVLYTPSRE